MTVLAQRRDRIAWLLVPPKALVAVAAHARGWHLMPHFTVSCCVVGAVVAWMARRLLPQAQSRP